MQPVPKREKIRILLVDDHIVLRMGLVTAAGAEPDMEVVAETSNGADALKAYRQHRPDVVVLDLRMQGLSGVDTVRLLREEFGQVRVVVFSNYAHGEEVYQVLKAGASGFVVKEMALERLLDAIRKVYRGEQYIPTEIAARVGERLLAQLSPRELDVLRLVGKGRSNKEIGSELQITEGTVKIHLTNILAKLGVSDRTQAILVAVKRGIIQLD
jgi:DNA-binding NarL/FixJ family response regulator